MRAKQRYRARVKSADASSSGSPENLAARVAAHPFLAGLKQEHLRQLAGYGIGITFDRDQLVFRAGEEANRFYLLEEGRVVLEAGSAERPVMFDQIGAGDLLGWSWLFPPYRWHFSARATEPVSAIYFYGTILREYCDENPALGYELFKRMSAVMVKRLQHARSELVAALAPKA